VSAVGEGAALHRLADLFGQPSASGHFDLSRMPTRTMPTAGPQWLELLTAVGLAAFGEAGPAAYGMTREDFYEKLLGINPLVFRLIGDDLAATSDVGAVAGMICVLPLKRTSTAAYTQGYVSQFEFDERHIAPVGCSEPCDFYMQAAYLRPADRHRTADLAVALARSIAQLSADGLQKTNGAEALMLGEATTALGTRILGSFGLIPRGCSKDNHPILYLPASDADGAHGASNRQLLAQLVCSARLASED
jgi:hypothetical protein